MPSAPGRAKRRSAPIVSPAIGARTEANYPNRTRLAAARDMLRRRAPMTACYATSIAHKEKTEIPWNIVSLDGQG